MPHVIFNTPDELRRFVARYPADDRPQFIELALSSPFPIYFYYSNTTFTNRRGWQSDLNNHPGMAPDDALYACVILDPDSYPEYFL